MKVLLISAAAGAGHIRAAQAIKKQIELDHPDWNIEHIDLLDYLSIPSKKIFFDSYGVITKKAPFLWGWFFDIFNKPNVTKISDKIVKSLILIHSNKIINYINISQPDVIICTHPTATNVITIKSTELSKKPDLWTVVTDYKMHLFWVHKNSNYFVPTEEIKKELINKYNFNANNVVVSGIPISPDFYTSQDIPTLKNKYSFNNNPIILILSGGEGLVKSDKITKEIIKIKAPLNIITIAGKNKKLKEKIEEIKPPSNIIYQPIGWTEKIQDYMKMADIIITKPGGMTITECLTLKKSLIIFDPIPGQEEGNVEFLQKNNLATICKDKKKINPIITNLLKQKPTIDWSAPKAVEIITKTIANFFNQ